MSVEERISLPSVGLWGELPHPLCFDISSKRDLRSIKYSINIRPIHYWLIIGSYKKIWLSHEMGFIDTAPLFSMRKLLWPSSLYDLREYPGFQDTLGGLKYLLGVCLSRVTIKSLSVWLTVV